MKLKKEVEMDFNPYAYLDASAEFLSEIAVGCKIQAYVEANEAIEDYISAVINHAVESEVEDAVYYYKR